MLRGNRRLDIQVVLVILQRRTTSVLFVLGMRKIDVMKGFTCMLKIITFDVYGLLDQGAIFSYVTPLLA